LTFTQQNGNVAICYSIISVRRKTLRVHAAITSLSYGDPIMSRFRFFITLATLVLISGCGGGRLTTQSPAIKSVAIVSFTVNNYGFFGQGPIDQQLINDNINGMLSDTEQILSKRWSVKPVQSFIDNPAYQALTVANAKRGLSSPVLNNCTMPICSDNRNALVKGVLSADQAKQLCSTLEVDAVVMVYSEWTLDTGKFVPTVKALTKNCFSMYDKNGTRLPYMRKDLRGERVIGGPFAGVYINEDTIDQWVNAYRQSVTTVFQL
jgi:hypothetical protein